MKVTKIIREYVEDQVKDKYSQCLDDIRKSYIEEKEIINKKIQAIADSANADIENLLLDNLGWSGPEDWNIISVRPVSNVSKESAIREKTSTIRKKIADSIKNILVTLELGATKAELENLIKNA